MACNNSHPTVVFSSRLVLLNVKTSKKDRKGKFEGNVEVRKGLDRKGKYWERIELPPFGQGFRPPPWVASVPVKNLVKSCVVNVGSERFVDDAVHDPLVGFRL